MVLASVEMVVSAVWVLVIVVVVVPVIELLIEFAFEVVLAFQCAFVVEVRLCWV